MKRPRSTKRLRLGLLVGTTSALLAAGTAGILCAQSRYGNYAPAALGQLDQAVPQALREDSTFSVSAFPLYPSELAAGEGQQETNIFCGQCHSTRYITTQPPLSSAAWEAVVSKMRKTYGAGIPESAAQKIVQYLKIHYSPK
ncbi:MAG: sulfide dehydrogenase [Acidipila sp.]|nr:sulfide dehydrogenase [Acidipila sp.]